MKHFIVLLLFMVLLCGCSKTEAQDTETVPFVNDSHHFSTEFLPLYQTYTDYAVWGDSIYFSDADGIYRYVDGADTVEQIIRIGGDAIDVYEDEIFLISDDGISVFDTAYELVSAYSYSDTDVGRGKFICASAEWIVYAYQVSDAQFTTYRFFALNRHDTTICRELTETICGNMPMCMVTDMEFRDTERLSLTFLYNPGDTDSVLYVEADLAAQEIVVRQTLPYMMGYSVVGNELYCLTNQLDYPQLILYDLQMTEKHALLTFDTASLTSAASMDIEYPRFSLHVTDQQIFLFDLQNGLVCFKDRNSSASPLRIVIPDTGYRGMNFNEKFEGAISQYSAESGRDVTCLVLPMENYEEKIAAKLLAGDADFDLFVLPNTIQSQLTRSIVEKNAYMPLETFDALDAAYEVLYDGFADTVTNNGHICGLPIWMAYSSLRINRELFAQYDLPVPEETWTFEDVWALCEMIDERKLDIRVFSNGQAQMSSLIMECLEYSEFDRTALEQLFENIRYYMDRDVLAYDNDPPGGSRLSWNEECDALFYTTYGLPAAPNHDNLNMDTAELYPYPRAADDAPHYIRAYDMIFMNANAIYPEEAAKFLAVLYNSGIDTLGDFCRINLNPYEARIMKNGKLYTVCSDALYTGTEDIYYELLYGDSDPSDLAEQYYRTIKYHIDG